MKRYIFFKMLLLVYDSLLILINAKSCKKENDFFAKYSIYTSKCKILQKRKRLFRETFHLLVHVSILIPINAKSCKKKTSFSRDIPFISTCFIVNTSKCKILQKRKRLFREIFHLLVHVSLLILVNAKSCKKENEFFARYSIY